MKIETNRSASRTRMPNRRWVIPNVKLQTKREKSQKCRQIKETTEDNEAENKLRLNLGNAVTDTHLVFDILIGAGVDQQPHTVRATKTSGTHQRRPSAL